MSDKYCDDVDAKLGKRGDVGVAKCEISWGDNEYQIAGKVLKCNGFDYRLIDALLKQSTLTANKSMILGDLTEIEFLRLDEDRLVKLIEKTFPHRRKPTFAEFRESLEARGWVWDEGLK